jgi:protease-4
MKQKINIKKSEEKNELFSWKKVILFLFVLWISSILFNALFFSDIATGNVAVIDIKGVISSSVDGGVFGSSGANPDTIISLIDEAEANPNVKAIIFEVNSGGGSPVASDEIAKRIEKINKTTVAFIRDIGASGAYWIAVSTDHIMANRMSLVGSIGVTSTYLSFEGLLDKYNITYNRMVAGKYKDMGTPLKELTSEEEELFNELLFDLRDEFIIQVSTNREMGYDEIEELATGQVWTGKKALTLGLVDSLGSYDELNNYLEEELNTTIEYSRYEREVSLKEALYGVTSNLGNSIGNGMTNAFFGMDKNSKISIY